MISRPVSRLRRARPGPTGLVAFLLVAVALALVGGGPRVGGGGGGTLSVETAPGSPAGAGAGARHEAAAAEAPADVYAAATSTAIPPELAGMPQRVYVPNNLEGTIDVINPNTYRVVDRYPVGQGPHHVTPSWDRRLLYVNNTIGNSLTVIDPRKGKPRRTIPVRDPYNLYFTPDGSKAIVVAERHQQLDFRDPDSWKLIKSVPVPWLGVDHLDFSADGDFLVASAEFSGIVVKVDVESMRVVSRTDVGGLPIDVKVSPDGRFFYVANQGRSGVSMLNGRTMREVDFLPTGTGAHGLQVSRDARWLYVSNRLEGTISVIDFERRRVRDTWTVGGSPDMLQISPDGRELWASNRYHSSVSVVNARTGRVLHTIPAGAEPHGIAYIPQPGRYSVGHNGVYR